MSVRAAVANWLSDWPWLAAVGIALVAAVLRIQPLNESLWLDELHTAWCAVGPLDEVWRRAAIGNQGPLFFWLEWLSASLLGPSEFSLRLVSFVSGSVLPLVVFWFARHWSTALVGLVAAVLTAVDATEIFYASEARPYALVQLLAVMHVAITAQLLWRPSALLRGSWVAIAAVLFYLHFTAALIVAAECATYALLLAIQPKRVAHRWTSLALDTAVLGVVCLPEMATLSSVVARRENWAAFVPSASLDAIFAWWPCALAVAYLTAGLAIDKLIKKEDDASATANRQMLFGILLIGWLLVPCLLAWTIAATGFARLFFERYLLICAPAAVLLAAYCVELAPWRWAKLALGLLLVAVAIHASDIYPRLYHERRVIAPRGEDWRGCVVWMNEHAQESQFPVLVYSGLIEADELQQPHDELLEDYCLAAVTSLYPLQIDRGDLFALPLREPGTLNQVAEMIVVHRGGAWLIARGSSKTGKRIADAIVTHLAASAPGGTSAKWTVEGSQSFDNVQVLLLRSASALHAANSDPSLAAP